MGLPVLVIGESGSGKTTSLRNFGEKEALVFRLAKPLPKKIISLQSVNLRNMAYSERYDVIKGYIRKYKDKVKTYIIDDFDYLMFFEQQQRRNEGGYAKYVDLACHMTDLLNFVDSIDDDVVVYFLGHVESDSDTGKMRAITAGKMIDKQLGTIEALFNEVIYAKNDNGKYIFIVHNDGSNTAKTPMRMFDEDEIENDLKIVDRKVREYYGIQTNKKEEMDNATKTTGLK